MKKKKSEPKPVKISKKKSAPFYIDPTELRNEIVYYKSHNVISNDLGVMLIKLANKYATKENFSNYTYKDEFINDAVYRMVEKLNMLDLNHPKCNIFAYLTKTCERCYIAKILKEKKFQKLKDKYRQEKYGNFQLVERLNDGHLDDGDFEFNEFISEQIEEVTED